METMRVHVLVLCISLVCADIYLQNPRGSNNRLDETGRRRRNARRLFDSQNNNRGGYNVGPGMQFYVGSKIHIEWTNQHSCGGNNNNCQLIIQYMCDKAIRDGSKTKTIPLKHEECANNNCNTDLRFGMHESNEYYQTCKSTSRNFKLYTADQRLRDDATTTRQSNRGRRNGYECPEERDYYPYWRPSPWKDIVVMVNDTERCDYYTKESQNVKSRFHCQPPEPAEGTAKVDGSIPITESKCNEFKGVWVEVPSHNIDAPDCKRTAPSRDNHNGNGLEAVMNSYDWTVPDDVHSQCVLRIRYNISTNDFDPFTADSHSNIDKNQPSGGVDIYQDLEMEQRTAEMKGYYMKGDPIVEPFMVFTDGQDISKEFKLKLAINTAQFGRTFQDRSHVFSIIPRPEGLKEDARIVNVNVRGKRGNIVQTYPATEYDFVPNTVHVKCDDTYIHLQWTGSDNNPGNNNGQGRRGTDRSNVCLMGKNKYEKSTTAQPKNSFGYYGVSYPEDMRNDGLNIFGAEDNSEQMLCTSGTSNGANDELDESPAYYNHIHYSPDNGGLIQCKCAEDSEGRKISSVWYYMCTRNNNFSNRSQKGKMICKKE